MCVSERADKNFKLKKKKIRKKRKENPTHYKKD